MAKPSKVLKIRLGALISLDLVRLEEEQVCLVVFAESGIVQRRTQIRLPFDVAMKVARFLAGVVSADDEGETVIIADAPKPEILKIP